METLLISAAIFSVLFALLGIGLFFGKSAIKGSCGGVMGEKCQVCEGSAAKCSKLSENLPGQSHSS
jgi:hypothetical protein